MTQTVLPTTQLIPGQILSGFQGQLYSNGLFLAEVNTWHAQLNITNSDYQPAGRAQRIAIFQAYHISLTFTETVYRDTKFLAVVLNAIRGIQTTSPVGQDVLDGKRILQIANGVKLDGSVTPPVPGEPFQPNFSFMGLLVRNDGSIGQYTFNEVVPDGAVDIANVTPGDVLNRSWTWRVNGEMTLDQELGLSPV